MACVCKQASQKNTYRIGVPIVAQLSCGVGRRHGLDPEWLRLWCRPADVALIQPRAWELPYATGTALTKTKKKKKLYVGYICTHSYHKHGKVRDHEKANVKG